METRRQAGFGTGMRINTLLFHDVVSAGCFDESGFSGADADVYKLECGDFRRHLKALGGKERHAPAIASELAGPAASPAGPWWMLTFDDGGIGASLHVADLLDDLGWKAHFFVTTSRIKSAGFLDPAQIRDLDRRGHIVGSHSCSHPTRMSYCTSDQLDSEWQESVETLSGILGKRVVTASVPGGYYSRRVASSAAKAGVRLLFTSEPVTSPARVDGCVVLGRFTVKRGRDPEWSSAIAGGEWQPQVEEYLFWNAKKLVKKALGTVWLRARVCYFERRG